MSAPVHALDDKIFSQMETACVIEVQCYALLVHHREALSGFRLGSLWRNISCTVSVTRRYIFPRQKEREEQDDH